VVLLSQSGKLHELSDFLRFAVVVAQNVCIVQGDGVPLGCIPETFDFVVEFDHKSVVLVVLALRDGFADGGRLFSHFYENRALLLEYRLKFEFAINRFDQSGLFQFTFFEHNFFLLLSFDLYVVDFVHFLAHARNVVARSGEVGCSVDAVLNHVLRAAHGDVCLLHDAHGHGHVAFPLELLVLVLFQAFDDVFLSVFLKVYVETAPIHGCE